MIAAALQGGFKVQPPIPFTVPCVRSGDKPSALQLPLGD
jgi:hypothetical protein